MGLFDYDDIVCGLCEGQNVAMVPLMEIHLEGPNTMYPVAACRDCGFLFIPPNEVVKQKRAEWGKAIRTQNRKPVPKGIIKLDPEKVAPVSPAESKRQGSPICEKCGKKMKLDNTSTARYTVFLLWICQCGFQKIEKQREHFEEEPSDEELKDIDKEKDDELTS